MFSTIKLYIIGAAVGAFALLGGYAKYQSSQKEKYQSEAKLNKSKADSADKRIEAHEDREEIEQENANTSADDVDSKLHDYYRDQGP